LAIPQVDFVGRDAVPDCGPQATGQSCSSVGVIYFRVVAEKISNPGVLFDRYFGASLDHGALVPALPAD